MAVRRSPTVRTWISVMRSAVTSYSKPTISKPRSRLPRAFPRRDWAAQSRCVRSHNTGDESPRWTLRGDDFQAGMTPRYVAVLTIVLMLGLVLTRAIMLRRRGVQAMKFGKIDKTDFFIPPFAFFYFYLVFATAFRWPTVSAQEFFRSDAVSWTGVALCVAGLSLLLWSLVSFGRSFRVGIDVDHPDQLVTTGVFAHTRNPIYVAFAAIL